MSGSAIRQDTGKIWYNGHGLYTRMKPAKEQRTVRPFSLLIKPASADCNLRCEYCFYLRKSALYPAESQHRMPDKVLEALIAGYLKTEQPGYVFAWQGGEPSLMGVDFFRRVTDLQQQYGTKGCSISNALQTNATLLDEDLCHHLARYRFLTGVSLDGPPVLHDRYRKSADGRGTYRQVMKGIENLRKCGAEFNALVLVNAENAGYPGEVYRQLCELGIQYHQYIPCVEFDPSGKPMPFTITGEQWGRFLCGIFDQWVSRDINRVSVRLFDSLLAFMLEGTYTSCTLAGHCCQYFVVEYNGDVYPCDFFVEPGRRLGNILENTWEEMQASAAYLDFGALKHRWNPQCSTCSWLAYCSGDCLKHRIYGGMPPENTSWLCPGWEMFYRHAIPSLREIALSIRQKNGGGRSVGSLFTDTAFGRNDPCFCGSGEKYKKCHGRV